MNQLFVIFVKTKGGQPAEFKYGQCNGLKDVIVAAAEGGFDS